MLPLKSLPKILKHASPHGRGLSSSSVNGNGNGNGVRIGALAAIKYNDMDTASQISSSSQISQMEAEEKELRERLIVLEEQKFLVGEMIDAAKKGRRWDEVKALVESKGELEREVDSLNGVLGQLDWRGVYAGHGGGDGEGAKGGGGWSLLVGKGGKSERK